MSGRQPHPLQGWLKKKAARGLVKGFKKRYFKQVGTKLEYYKQNPNEEINPSLGSIDLELVSGVTRGAGNLFSVETPHRKYELESVILENSADWWVQGFSDWIEYLREKKGGNGNNGVSPSEPPSDPRQTSETPIRVSSRIDDESIFHIYPGQQQQQKRSSSLFENGPTRSSSNTESDVPALPMRNQRSLGPSLVSDSIKKDEEIRYLRQRMQELQEQLKDARMQNKSKRAFPNTLDKKMQAFWQCIKDDDVQGLSNLVLNDAKAFENIALGVTPIHFASQHGSTQCSNFLFERGLGKPDDIDRLGRTPLHYAIENLRDYQLTETVKLLLRRGANPELGDAGYDEFPPLHAACLKGQKEPVRLLIGQSASLDRRDGRLSWTPLHWAVASGEIGVVELLLEKGVDVISVDGVSPLDLAKEEDCDPAIRERITGYLRTSKKKVIKELRK